MASLSPNDALSTTKGKVPGTLPGTFTNFTLMGWWRITPLDPPTGPGLDARELFYVGNDDYGFGNPSVDLSVIDGGPDTPALQFNAYITDGGGSTNLYGAHHLSYDTWYHIVLVKANDTWTLYLSTETGSLNVTLDLTFTNALGITPLGLYLIWQQATAWVNVKGWEAALTADEIRAERDRWGVTRTANLWAQLPLRHVDDLTSRAGTSGTWADGAGFGSSAGVQIFTGDPGILQRQSADWTFRAASAVATGTTSLTITKPTGTVDGDYLFMAITHKGGAFATMPAGWTVIRQSLQGSTRHETFWKRASGEGANYSVTGLADTATGVIRTYLGGPPAGANPVAYSAENLISTATPDIPSIDLDQLDCLILTSFGNGAVLPSVSNPISNLNGENRVNAFDSTSRGSTTNGSDCAVGLADAINPSVGETCDDASDPMQWSSNTITEGVVQTIALAPDPDFTLAPTRFYLSERSHGVLISAESQGDWDSDPTGGPLDADRVRRGIHHVTWRLSRRKRLGGQIRSQNMDWFGTTPEDALIYRWMSEPLAAQTISGTINLNLMVTALNTAAVFWHLHVWVVESNNETVRGTLLTDYIDPGPGNQWTSTATHRALAGAQTLSSLAIQDGDRLVIELGGHITAGPLNFGDPALQVFYGTTGTSHVPRVDATVGSTTSNLVGYVDFSNGITERLAAAVDPPPNQDCASPVDISAAALPHYGLAYSTDESQAPFREVWYTFTPDHDGRYIFNTLHGNYRTQISIWVGTCGSLTLGAFTLTNTNVTAWIQASQSWLMWDATSGVTYYLRVRTVGDTFNARDGAGELTVSLTEWKTIQTDDLIVNCQHIVAFRDGVVINVTTAFYTFTPTGSAVDYTLRPMDNLNGGTHADVRYFACTFGDSPLVEILDVVTLNVGESEIDYIIDALGAGSASKNLSSAVFNRDGLLYFGFFGDNYSVVGGLSSVPAADVRALDGTHADNQTGAPWPAAADLPVTYETEGSDYVELSSDQTTLFYTSAGNLIKRYDVVANTQLADFASVPDAGGPRPGLRGLRLLPPGDGSAGLIVAHGDNVVRLDATGVIIQTYTPDPVARAHDLDKVELTADGLGFWVSDQFSTWLFHFDLESGTQLQSVDTGLPAGQLCGFSIYNGYRAGLAPTPPPPAVGATPCPVDFPIDTPAGGNACPAPLFSDG